MKKTKAENYNFDNKSIVKYLILFLLFSFLHQAKGEKILILDPNIDDFVLKGDYFDVFEDPEKKYSIEQISNPKFEGFSKKAILYAHNKNSQSAYWLKFSVKKSSADQKRFLLETYSPHTNLIEVFLPGTDGHYTMQNGGENFKFSQRIYKTKNIVFDLPVNKTDKIVTFYIRIDSKNYSSFDFRVKTINYFLFYITNEYYFLGLYYGILLIMAVYNLLVYFTVKDRVYLYYVFYVLSSAIITMTDDGLGFQYLWPDFPLLSRPIGYTIAPIILMLAFILYSTSFLNLKTRFYSLWQLIVFITFLYLLYFIISIFSLGEALPIVYTLPFLATYIVACISYVKGYKASRFFILGYSSILISIVIIQLRAEHIIEGGFFAVYSFNIGLVFEVVIFSFALSDRIKIIKKEGEQAQQVIIETLRVNKDLQEKVNRELEEKVAERTQELSSKNKELEDVNNKLLELNNTINKINAGLDYDNWYLKKDIKNDLQARILEEEVPFEEFSKIFPEEHSCLKYLAEQKWKNFFSCRKCGNLKFTDSIDRTKRKCTVCGFVESATAYTLFHGVRFPLNKAFYLTYLFYKKDTGRNLSDLADLLGIRRNTCGKFRTKVIESREQFHKINKHLPLESWEDLVIIRKRK